MAYELGTPVIDMYGNQGFISAVQEPKTRGLVIGASGLTRTMHEYEICLDKGSVTVLPDGIVSPWVDRAQHLPRVENVADRRAAIVARSEELQAAARVSADEARKRSNESTRVNREKAVAAIENGAKAVIVAELVADRSDSQSDYFGSTVTQTVVLGFSAHVRDLFSEMRKFAAVFAETAHLVDAPESAEHREKYSMGAGFYLKKGSRNSDGWQVRKIRLYNGADSIPTGADWQAYESAIAAPVTKAESAPVASVSGLRIEQHTHTKGCFDMFIVIMGERVERETFDDLNAKAKAAGGWYSRPWGKTPGGFAFKDREKADSFLATAANTVSAEVEPGTVAADRPAKPAAVAPAMGDKLRDLADKLQKDIDSKFADRLTNTPKRRCEADKARNEGRRLERTQAALRALADRHDAGSVPSSLARVTTKAAVYDLMRSEIDTSRAGYYDAGIDTGKPALTTAAALELWAMVAAPSEEAKAAEELHRKVTALQFANIPGYFPTPAAIVADMIESADIPEGVAVDVLEPEGGSGAILDAVRAARPLSRLKTFERHASLRDVLRLKGYELVGSDFLEAEAAATFDFVLMNPPFENAQDIAHVRHAFKFLKPGGRLVAIMSTGPFFRSDRKAQEFREWFDSVAGDKLDIPAGAFKASGTGVATVMITVSR
jgi:SAM-dependent methyltransferase